MRIDLRGLVKLGLRVGPRPDKNLRVNSKDTSSYVEPTGLFRRYPWASGCRNVLNLGQVPPTTLSKVCVSSREKDYSGRSRRLISVGVKR